MNLKYYIRGVGVGLVTATLILAVAYHIRPVSDVPLAQPNSSRDIMANLRTSEAPSRPVQESSALEEIPLVPENSKNEPASGRAESASAQESTESPSIQETQPPQPAIPEEPSSQASVVTVVFDQIRGSEDAAQILERVGLVSDWREFNSFLIRNGYAARIHNGTYAIEAGSPYEVMAEIITRR